MTAVEDNLDIGNGGGSREKIQAVQKSLANAENGRAETIQGWGDFKTLAPLLFRRATVEFLDRHSVDELSAIVREAYAELKNWMPAKAEGPRVAELPSSSEQRRRLAIILSDRSFIINTIAATARAHGLIISAFLHPILSLPGGEVSLSFIEVESPAAGTMSAFLADVSAGLRSLEAVTDDFKAMREFFEVSMRSFDSSSPSEELAFLQWLEDERFVFEGACHWRSTEGGINPSTAGNRLGLFRLVGESPGFGHIGPEILEDCAQDANRGVTQRACVILSRLRQVSPVHHRTLLTHVLVVRRGSRGEALEIFSFVGQFTSKALAEETSTIPLVRVPVRHVLDGEGIQPNSHLYKAALTVVDLMPKPQALMRSKESLAAEIKLLLGAETALAPRARVEIDESHRGAFIVVAIPVERFTQEIKVRLERRLREALAADGSFIDSAVTGFDTPLCRMYYYIPLSTDGPSLVDERELERELIALTSGWVERLTDLLGNSGLSKVAEHYRRVFPGDYQAARSPEAALQDVHLIEALTEESPLAIALQTAKTDSEPWRLTLARRGSELILSQALHVLEHAGFEVLKETSYRISHPAGPVVLHEYAVRPQGQVVAEITPEMKRELCFGLGEMFQGRIEDDSLNGLMLKGGLPLPAIRLLRSLCMLLWQMRKFATRQTVREALVQYPSQAVALWEAWRVKFDPSINLSISERRSKFDEAAEAFRNSLHGVQDITVDRVLRSFLSIIEQTVRTNFFHAKLFNGDPVLAYKIHSENLEILLPPRPLFEVFVYCAAVEGVHLRSSRVARGGLRWSDRREDYRTEVRDLMKTQQVKNALIVPSGAKGGFFVKDLPSDPRQQPQAVKTAYQEFIRALLSLADNLVDGKVVPPAGLIIYDGNDPYFVVAADKGTATFSDVANNIAVNEFGFWLGDAFASGGSKGYDHKKYGVTARGAWEAAKQHFNQARIDYENSPFTVIGIGDMSGDVFGNGLLISKNMALKAAFNHRHIFLDPSPDVGPAYEERKRLFTTAGSQWSDYRKELISKGGGVFERQQKEIILTPEVRAALDVPTDTPKAVSGEQLISLVLKAPADLLWNGGIGTYVKSRAESDSEVNDATNDRVRVNADELRVRVVAEGGNLGFTQLARIDFAQRGGLINTDAIDNSGGVDTSDHEVNLKILFSEVMRRGKMDLAKRDETLLALAEPVVSDVLSHNRSQATLLAFSVRRSSRTIEYFKSLIGELVRKNYLGRSVHFLPSDEELEDRAARKLGLVRPELAMILAGVKLWTKDELIASGLTKEPLLRTALLDYFPESLAEAYREEILSHPLADNIIATQISNELTETVGLTFVHRMCVTRSVTAASVLTALLAAKELLDVKGHKRALEAFDTFAHSALYFEYRLELSAGLREATAWLLLTQGNELKIEEVLERYREGIRQLSSDPGSFLKGELHGYFSTRLATYPTASMPEATRVMLAVAPMLPLLFEMLWTAAESNSSIAEAAASFCAVHDALGLLPVLEAQRSVVVRNKWEHELRIDVYEQLRRSIARIASDFLRHGIRQPEDIAKKLQENPSFEVIKGLGRQWKDQAPEVAMVAVFARQLRMLQI